MEGPEGPYPNLTLSESITSSMTALSCGVVCCRWLLPEGTASEQPFDTSIVQRLQNFGTFSRTKKVRQHHRITQGYTFISFDSGKLPQAPRHAQCQIMLQTQMLKRSCQS